MRLVRVPESRSEDSTAWPEVGPGLTTLEWSLRYATECASPWSLEAASVVAAYRELVLATPAKRARVITALRAATLAQLERRLNQ